MNSEKKKNGKNRPATVAIVEDRAEIRASLENLIKYTEDLECAGSFKAMEDALRALPENLPDVLLCDIGLPGMDGISGIKILKEKFPHLAVLMLTVYDDDDRIIDALCAGATGYLLKHVSPQRLVSSIKEVLNGGAPMSPEIARRVIELFKNNPPPRNTDHDLTPHELRLLKMLVEGHNYNTAAAELGVSVNTVSFHIKNIYDKLQVHSKSQAVAKALRNRLV
jgi:Response regulator containing a CheY-like receiver domain and an HTH DNA-binding domain